ncbi:MAG: hypothetical protein KatS3mg105_0484 [Gemmatales bacterium]|nr:MAG: hypothetical protein KatS3mg105_0484 [Gemmatales bacterium]
MPVLTVSKRIEAPVQQVFDAFTDLHTIARHISAIEKLEILTDGPVGVGTRFRETRIMFGKEASEEMEFIAFEQGKSYTLQCDSCGCRITTQHDFTPLDGGTLVTLKVRVQALTLLAKLSMPLTWLMLGSMRRCIEKDLDEMASVVERLSKTL